MQNELGEIRRSQVVTTYGPGSIVDFRAGKGGDAAISVVASGLETWERVPPNIIDATRIFEPRLQKLLRVGHFRLAPVAPQPAPWDKKPKAVYLEGRRFPNWQQCPKCHTIATFSHWRRTQGDPALICPSCKGDTTYAVPVRFVMTCRRGHLDEFDWNRWVAHKPTCSSSRLTLKSRGGTGLASLILHCESCGADKSMDGALSKGTFKGSRCRGKRPWLDDEEECDEQPIAVQRGASNLYFARPISSLDIPPWSDPIMKMLGVNWAVLAAAEEDKRLEFFGLLDQQHRYTQRLGLSAAEILEAIKSRTQMLEDCEADALLREEHLRLLEPTQETGVGHEFETEAHPVPEKLMRHVSNLIEVCKLREVRAITGFTRVSPPGPQEDGEKSLLCKLSKTETDWLPAVEIRGEGIYIELNKDQISIWLKKQERTLSELTARMQKRYVASWEAAGRDGPPPERPIHPTYLLVHTLAHALIRQLSLDCGYSSASLRERLYVETEGHPMAGMLIYTGSSDADGTLGGLSRQATPARLEELFVDAIRNLAWCSNDPLCIHGEASSEPLNRAACHSCVLVAETSCETFNQLLDRSVLIGTPDNRDLGFFKDLLGGA